MGKQMNPYDHELNESLGMRLLGGLVALIVVGVVSFLLPGWAQIQFYIPLLWSKFSGSEVRNTATVLWHLWWVGALFAAAWAGFVFGAGRTIELLGYLWLTASPPDASLTRRLWLILGAMAAVTYVLVGLIAK